MKNTFKVLGVIALTAIIGFSMTACEEEDDSPKPQKSQSVIDFIDVIAYGNGKFVAVGESYNQLTETYTNKIATSTDGVTWTAVTKSVFGDDDYIHGIVYGNGKFVAVGYSINYSTETYTNKIATSTDGVTWTAVTQSVFGDDDYIHGIVYGNGKFVAYNYSKGYDNTKIATSTDGITWTAVDFSSILIYSISYCNGKFFAGGSSYNSSTYASTYKIATSTDGTTWTEVTQIVFVGDYSEIRGIVYGNDKFVAIGHYYNQSTYTYTTKIVTSTDGVTWTASGFISCEYIGEIVYGNGKFVAISSKEDGKMATSTDGVTWTEVDIGNLFNYVITDKDGTTYSGSYISAIVYGGGKFVAGGGDGVIATSTDGIKWTKSVINHK